MGQSRGLFLCLLGLVCIQAQERPYRANDLANVQRLEDRRIIVYFSGLSVPEARQLSDMANDFLTEIETDWLMTFQDLVLTLSVKVDHRGTTESFFDPRRKYAILNLKRFEPEVIETDLDYAVLIGLLNQRTTRLPDYLEEGISHYFSGRRIKDMDLVATYAVWKHPTVSAFLGDKDVGMDDAMSWRVFCTLIVEQAWQEERTAFTKFLHTYFQGHSVPSAFTSSGLVSNDEFLARFQSWVETQYSLSRLVQQPGFWRFCGVLIGTLVLILHLFHCWKVSGFDTLELEPNPEPSAGDLAFSGPAFGRGSNDLKTVPRTTEPVYNQPTQDKQDGTAKPAMGKTNTPRDVQKLNDDAHFEIADDLVEEIEDEVEASFARFGDEVRSKTPKKVELNPEREIPPNSSTSSGEGETVQRAVEKIEDDLDAFFDQSIEKKVPKKKKKEINEFADFEDLDEHIDDFFDL